MEYILIAALFVIQLLTLFWVTMLNTKLNRFKELELQQQQVIAEMDNSIGAYLVEMKDENDRLLQEIQQMNNRQQQEQQALIQQMKQQTQKAEIVTPSVKVESQPIVVPKTVAATAYEKHIDKEQPTIAQEKVSAILKEEQPKPLTFEQKVKQMQREGLSIEQIAKKTNKGKTEIELLLKFSS